MLGEIPLRDSTIKNPELQAHAAIPTVPVNACAMPNKLMVFYKCIGAKDRIFDHCLFRSSLPTIPVPTR